MDSSHWPQGIGGGGGVDEAVTSSSSPPVQLQKKPRPEKEKALNCPRCNSTNTKFCYYNNYSLSQPRYFCKTCRRYWTEGGSLRNVPVGGGSRKNTRRSTSTTTTTITTSTSKKILDLSSIAPLPPPPPAPPVSSFVHQNPNKMLLHQLGGHDLNLAYNPPTNAFTGISEILNLNPNSLEILKNGISSFMVQPHHSDFLTSSSSPSGVVVPNLHDHHNNTQNNSKFTLPDLGDSGYCNGFSGNLDHHQPDQESGSAARVFFPNLEDLKPGPGNDHHYHHNHHHQFIEHEEDRGQNGDNSGNEANGFWNGMLGGGGGGGASW